MARITCYNNGNTTYTWNSTTGEMSVNGVGQGTPGGNRVFLTIWDGGGNDTYDMSNYGGGVSIDLRAGSWSITSQTQRANLGARPSSPTAPSITALLFGGNYGVAHRKRHWRGW